MKFVLTKGYYAFAGLWWTLLAVFGEALTGNYFKPSVFPCSTMSSLSLLTHHSHTAMRTARGRRASPGTGETWAPRERPRESFFNASRGPSPLP